MSFWFNKSSDGNQEAAGKIESKTDIPKDSQVDIWEVLGVNRNSVDNPPKYTWLVQDETESTKWKPFSHFDCDNLEEGYKSAINSVSVKLGHGTVTIFPESGERVYKDEYFKTPDRPVVRALWFWQRKTSGPLQWSPFTDEQMAKIEAFFADLYAGVYASEVQPYIDVGDSHQLVATRRPISGYAKLGLSQVSMVRPVKFMSPSEDESKGKISMTEDFVWELVQTRNDFLMQNRRAVRRGYEEYTDELGDNSSIPVSHVLFMIHGIGESLWSKSSIPVPSIRQCAQEFGILVADQLEVLGSSTEQQKEIAGEPTDSVVPDEKNLNSTRVEVFPVEWFEAVHSEEKDLCAKMSSITLPTIPILREFANEVVVDVMMYLSPEFHQKIQSKVAAELERIHSLFMQKNPDYIGPFSIVAHSLGSIISFDLLSGQDKTFSLTPPTIQYPQLSFDLHHLVVLGSPIGLFLALRSVPIPNEYSLPKLHGNFYNIFHPNDPVAYRIEPLVNPEFKELDPVYVPFHKGGVRMHLALSRFNKDVLDKAKSVVGAFQTFAKPFQGGAWAGISQMLSSEPKAEEPEVNQSKIPGDDEPLKDVMLNKGRRFDYILQQSTVEVSSEYISALGGHTQYLGNPDVALFLARLALNKD